MTPWRGRGELIISMTLAETFIFLVFMVWYANAARTPNPPTTAEILQKENDDLKKELAKTKNELKDVREQLDIWAKFFNLSTGDGNTARLLPPSPEVIRRLCIDIGRGKPRCQDDNVLADVRLVNGATAIRILADSPALKQKLATAGINAEVGSVLRDGPSIERFLQEVRTFHKVAAGDGGECRFDYRFAYGTADDYLSGRERFEKYFYPAGITRAGR